MQRIAAAALMLVLSVGSSEATTVEVAKKCDAALAKAFPPRVAGNPAAGSAKGTGRDEATFYEKCVSKRGDLPSGTSAPK